MTQLSRPRLQDLENDLSKAVAGEVRFDLGSRAMYAAGASNYRQMPIGIVLPKDEGDVIRAIGVCHEFDAPVLPRGGGTSLAGQVANTAIILDMSKYMDQILSIDPDRRLARVQPGVVLDRLRDEAERFGLTFGPDPATHSHCTLGGMIGNNSCGVHSVMAGRTADNVEELDILTYEGHRMSTGPVDNVELTKMTSEAGPTAEIYRGLSSLVGDYADLIRKKFPDIPRRVSGYNLDELLPESGFNVARALVGTEGTCVTVLGATLKLIESPPSRVLVLLGFPDVYTAAERVVEIHSYGPIGLEGMDEVLVGHVKQIGFRDEGLALLPEGQGWLMAEFGGSTEDEARAKAQQLVSDFEKDGVDCNVLTDPSEQTDMWKVRESGLGATSHVPGENVTWEGWEDAAVPPQVLADYLRAFRGLLNRFEYSGALYGHFGDGCIHTRIDFDLTTKNGIAKYRDFVEQSADLVVSYGGSLSGEHGDGQARAELLPKMFGDEIVGAFARFKGLWDPSNRMNPGKVVNPNRLDENLRLGVDYRPIEVTTHFAYPNDEGDFPKAVLRCVGVGECRKVDAGTMCPSYMVTKEEKHSTRGRARLLFEMLSARDIKTRWRSEEVKDALDLCLGCKGCKKECPVFVDMATYKAEFLAHHYKRRVRPRTAYAMGLIYWWARTASRVPRLVNLLTQNKAVSALAKKVAGIAQERSIPTFAHRPFTRSFQPRSSGSKRVILWPDTFNNFFHPKVLHAGAKVLSAAGFDVTIPRAPLCCGRPLYDFGMLNLAKRQLRQILRELHKEIRAGTPVVGLEPSCVAVFRDEMINLFPTNVDAQRLSRQTFTLAEFLETVGYKPRQLGRNVLAHGHCHQKAIMGMSSDEAMLARLDPDYELLDSGCCGMAGAFGFEKAHYAVSVACGERVLLPAVRDAEQDVVIVADGFSCREQISQTTGRRALHLAEVLAEAESIS